jgi:hypothetical protein
MGSRNRGAPSWLPAPAWSGLLSDAGVCHGTQAFRGASASEKITEDPASAEDSVPYGGCRTAIRRDLDPAPAVRCPRRPGRRPAPSPPNHPCPACLTETLPPHPPPPLRPGPAPGRPPGTIVDRYLPVARLTIHDPSFCGARACILPPGLARRPAPGRAVPPGTHALRPLRLSLDAGPPGVARYPLWSTFFPLKSNLPRRFHLL